MSLPLLGQNSGAVSALLENMSICQGGRNGRLRLEKAQFAGVRKGARMPPVERAGTAMELNAAALEEEGPSEIEAAIPERPSRRDALGWFCYLFHFLPVIYVVTGWLATARWALVVYLVFLPAMFLQWRLNEDSCVLNNVESLIRTGRWRNPSNREEGAWLRTLVNENTGWNLSRRQVDTFINAVLAVMWAVGLSRLLGWV